MRVVRQILQATIGSHFLPGDLNQQRAYPNYCHAGTKYVEPRTHARLFVLRCACGDSLAQKLVTKRGGIESVLSIVCQIVRLAQCERR